MVKQTRHGDEPSIAARPATGRSDGAEPCVLVVDDDARVVRALVRVLERDVCVRAETDPFRALERILSGERFDVVICDLSMPALDGAELYRRVLDHDAEQAERFVFVSGGVLNPALDAFLADSRNERHSKPVSISTLREIVSRRVSQRPNT